MPLRFPRKGLTHLFRKTAKTEKRWPRRPPERTRQQENRGPQHAEKRAADNRRRKPARKKMHKRHSGTGRRKLPVFRVLHKCFFFLLGRGAVAPCLLFQMGVVSSHCLTFARSACQPYAVPNLARLSGFRAPLAIAFRLSVLQRRATCHYATRLHKNIARALLNKARSTLVFILARWLRATSRYLLCTFFKKACVNGV